MLEQFTVIKCMCITAPSAKAEISRKDFFKIFI